MPEKKCEKCGQPIRKGEGYAETDIGTGKWVHWPSCPPSARVFPESSHALDLSQYIKKYSPPIESEVHKELQKITEKYGVRYKEDLGFMEFPRPSVSAELFQKIVTETVQKLKDLGYSSFEVFETTIVVDFPGEKKAVEEWEKAGKLGVLHESSSPETAEKEAYWHHYYDKGIWVKFSPEHPLKVIGWQKERPKPEVLRSPQELGFSIAQIESAIDEQLANTSHHSEVKKVEFKEGKWQFDTAMQEANWDSEIFDWMVGETVKDLDAAEKNEFWKQYNEWARLAGYHHSSPHHHSNPERICERCGKPIKEGETCAETDVGSGKYTHWPSCPPEEHVPKIEEKPTPQGEATIVDGLTWKDYYSLRDLRLLLWGLEKELVGKYGIIEAEPLASKVRELIKKKIEQVTSKIGSTPEHHSSGNPHPPASTGNPDHSGKFTVRFNEDTEKQEDIELEAPSPEAATIEAARKYSEKHGEYPKTARLLHSGNPDAVEAWRKRVLRPPF